MSQRKITWLIVGSVLTLLVGQIFTVIINSKVQEIKNLQYEKEFEEIDKKADDDRDRIATFIELQYNLNLEQAEFSATQKEVNKCIVNLENRVKYIERHKPDGEHSCVVTDSLMNRQKELLLTFK